MHVHTVPQLSADCVMTPNGRLASSYQTGVKRPVKQPGREGVITPPQCVIGVPMGVRQLLTGGGGGSGGTLTGLDMRCVTGGWPTTPDSRRRTSPSRADIVLPLLGAG